MATAGELCAQALTRSRNIRVPAGEIAPVSKLTSALTANGARLTTGQVYAANTVTVDELARIMARQRAAELRAYAERQDRIRHEAMAEQWEASW